MSFQSEAATVKAYFDTEWKAIQGDLEWSNRWGSKPAVVPVFYGNVEETPSGPQPFLRLTIATGDSMQAGLGGGATQRRWRTAGAVIVQIFVAINSGERIARQYADKVAAILRGQRVGDLQFRAPSLVVIGAQSGGAWWQLNVNTPYYRDEFL